MPLNQDLKRSNTDKIFYPSKYVCLVNFSSLTDGLPAMTFINMDATSFVQNTARLFGSERYRQMDATIMFEH
jgi:hypothetical protein